jgi:hypothetical protein
MEAFLALANAPEPIYTHRPASSMRAPILLPTRKLRERIERARASRKALRPRQRAANGPSSHLPCFDGNPVVKSC